MNPEILLSADPKSETPRLVFLEARGYPELYESLFVPALNLRRRVRGTFWTFWADRLIDLRLSVCESKEEYLSLVSEWYAFARSRDKISRLWVADIRGKHQYVEQPITEMDWAARLLADLRHSEYVKVSEWVKNQNDT